MKVHGAALLALILLSLLPAASPALGEQKLVVTGAFWGSATATLNARPGDINVPLNVLVQNVQPVSMTAVLYSLHLGYPFTNSTGGDLASAGVPSQPSGAVASLQFLLSIDSGASAGVYQLNMTVEFFTGLFSRESLNLTFPVQVSSPLVLDLLDAQWGSPGSVGSVSPNYGSSFYYVTVRNPTSTPLTSVSAALQLPDGFTSSSGSSVARSALPALQPGAPASMQFTIVVGPVPPGSYEGNVTFSFYDSTGSLLNYTTSVPLPVLESAPTFGVLSASWSAGALPMDARPGDSNVNLNVQLQNLMNGTASGLSFRLGLLVPFAGPNGAPYSYSSYPALSAGQTATVSFLVMVSPDATPGLYSLPLTVTYLKPTMERGNATLYVIVSVRPPVRLEVIDSGFGAPGNPNSVQPFEGAATYFVVLRNPSNVPMSGLAVTISLPRGMTGTSGLPYVTATAPALQPGQSVLLQFPVNVGDISIGVHAASAAVTFLDASNSLLTTDLQLTVRIFGVSSVSLSLSDDGVTAGSAANLTLFVRNDGTTDLFGMDVSVASTGLVLLDKARFHIDTLPVGGSYSVPLRLYASSLTAAGLYPLSVTLQYKDESGSTMIENRVVGVNVSPYSSPISLSLDDFRVYSARTNYRTVSFLASGGMVKSLQVSAIASSATGGITIVNGTGPWPLGDLAAGSSRSITVVLQPSSNFIDQLATISLTLSYVGPDGAAHSETRQLSVLVKGRPEVSVQSVRASPTPAVNGTRVTVTGTLLNSGTSTSLYTSVTLKPEAAEFSGASFSRYIGDLSVDTPTPFSISVDLPSTLKAGPYDFVMTVQYQDTYGSPLLLSVPFQLQVVVGQAPASSQPHQGAGSSDQSLLLAALALLVLLVLGFFLIRRRGRPKVE